MSRQKLTMVAVAWLLMAAGAGVLLRSKAIERLGEPGLKSNPLAGTLRREIFLPERVLDYGSTNPAPTAAEVKMLPEDTSFGQRLYRAPDGFEVFVRVVLMGTDRTSIHKPEFCLGAQDYHIVKRETTAVLMERPHRYALPTRKFTISKTGQLPSGEVVRVGGVYVFWFVADKRLTASHLARVGWITWELLRHGVLPRWAYVTCFSTCPPGQEEATFERVKQFIAAAVPEFQLTAGPATVAAPATAADRGKQ
jgi:hypothetical protein